jgi:acetyl/propionyl-CoA carboxylase alpha subunit
MIRKILIANRGEIACRITRTCHEMGIAVTAVYSDADEHALHVQMADEAVHIGPSPASESYLNIETIVAATQRTGADAVHPGYGFLAENPDFAQAVIDAGLNFIGPPVSAIAAMGKKRAAKRMLDGVPVVPGYMGDVQNDKSLQAAADEIGFPIMVKASAGGGGKGMRQVESAESLPAALEAARREARQAFGDDTLILEKVVNNARHIEIQIFGDQHGHIIALGERECTVQRRHQKIIEETPSTALTPDLRQRMCEMAISIGRQLGYYSAGTVEFLVDDEKHFYFMEMNTRLQVEHPVTEMVTGYDLVRWQIEVAEGGFLPPAVATPHGFTIEARVYAEDPESGFLPVVGNVLRWHEPSTEHLLNSKRVWAWPKIIIDSGIRTGDELTVHYDPLLAKVVAHGETREEAIRRLDYALSKLRLLGIRNNIAFLRRVLIHPDHLAGRITTRFVDDHPELLEEDVYLPPVILIAAAIARHPGQKTWRNNPNHPIHQVFRHNNTDHVILLTPHLDDGYYTVQLAEEQFQVRVWAKDESGLDISVNGYRQRATILSDTDDIWWVHLAGEAYSLQWMTPLPLPGQIQAASGSLRAPMPGQIIAIMATVNQMVEQGEILLTMEAMKMEHRIQAPYAGTVEAIHFEVGANVQADSILLDLRATDE